MLLLDESIPSPCMYDVAGQGELRKNANTASFDHCVSLHKIGDSDRCSFDGVQIPARAAALEYFKTVVVSRAPFSGMPADTAVWNSLNGQDVQKIRV